MLISHVVLQRLFWLAWHEPEETAKLVRIPLLLAVFDLFVVLALLTCWAYCWNVEEVYIMSHRILAIITLGFPLFLFVLLWSDIAPKRASASSGSQVFNGEHALSFGLTAAMLVGFTVVSVMDARK